MPFTFHEMIFKLSVGFRSVSLTVGDTLRRVAGGLTARVAELSFLFRLWLTPSSIQIVFDKEARLWSLRGRHVPRARAMIDANLGFSAPGREHRGGLNK
jgi:hypothetical protein